MVIEIYLQNPSSGCFFYPAHSGGRRPLEMKYTYLSNLGHIFSHYIWLWESISKTLLVVAYFSCTFRRETSLCPAPSGGRRPLEMKYTEYVWLWEFLSKTVILVTYFALHLQEGDPLMSCTFRRETPFGNEIYLIQLPGSCSFRVYRFMGFYLQNPSSSCLSFLAPSGGRCPLKIKYTYPTTLGHAVSEYILLSNSIS